LAGRPVPAEKHNKTTNVLCGDSVERQNAGCEALIIIEITTTLQAYT
jgi:hypothetical protein